MKETNQRLTSSIVAIFNHLIQMYPQLFSNALAEYKRLLSWKVSLATNHTVISGPLKHFAFVEDSSWSLSDRGAMILGLYEREVLDEITTSKKSLFIDLGAADGYYSVGLVAAGFFKQSFSYEINERSRAILKLTAIRNNVADQIVVRVKAEKDFWKDFSASELSESLILIDIEGGEFEIVDDSTFKECRWSKIIIELHEWMVDKGEEKLADLLRASSSTHTHKFVTTQGRDLSSHKLLEKWSDHDRWLVVSESRGQLMRWVIFDPISSPS